MVTTPQSLPNGPKPLRVTAPYQPIQVGLTHFRPNLDMLGMFTTHLLKALTFFFTL